MKLFAGTIHLVSPKEDIPEIDYDIIRIDETNFFIMGAVEQEELSQAEVLKIFEAHFGKIDDSDITIDGLQRVEILMQEYEAGSYESTTFEGPFVDMDDIIARFADSGEVLCVRELETSSRYNNMKVRVDFMF